MRRVAVALAAIALVAAACDATQSGGGGGGGKGDGLEVPFTIDDLPADVELGPPEAVLAGWEGVKVRTVCLDVNVSEQIDAGMRQGTRSATRQALTTGMLLEAMLTGMGIEVVVTVDADGTLHAKHLATGDTIRAKDADELANALGRG